MKRIALTGGGSGGHLFPLIAVAQQLRFQAEKRGDVVDLRYFGPRDIYTSYILKESIVTKWIISAKIRRYFSIKNIIDVPLFFFSLFQALWSVYWYMPDVLFSKGGTSSLPVVFACWWYRVPIFIHETDSMPGVVNQISSRMARKIYTSFQGVEHYFQNTHVERVGNPLRNDILAVVSRDPTSAKQELGIDSKKPLITVLGGSLGSTRINELILQSVETLADSYTIVHQIGTANYQEQKKSFERINESWSADKKKNYYLYAFLEERYALTLAASDLIVSRAGGVIFEIAALGIPSILIPLPESAHNHQVLNARTYEKSGAAIVIEEKDFSPVIIIETIKKIISKSSIQSAMQRSALAFSQPRAAETIAIDILNNTS